jgi:hypothetical protein
MTLEQIEARISEIEAIRTVCCSCELSFGLQVYLSGRLTNLNALKEEKIKAEKYSLENEQINIIK